MNIAFDALAIHVAHDRGMGRYCITLINTMVMQHPEDDFFYFNAYDEEHVGKYIPEQGNLHEIIYYGGVDNCISGTNEHEELFKGILRSFIERNGIDVFVVTCPFAGSLHYKRAWFGEIGTFVIFYDLIPYIFKENYLPSREMLVNYNSDLKFVGECDHVFSISESSREDLVRFADIPKERISVIYGTADDKFRKITDCHPEKLQKKYGIKKDKYILCVPADDERKNIAGLIKGFALLPDDMKNAFQLVIACKICKESVDHYMGIASSCNIESRVIFTNFISDVELIELYNGAEIIAFVSKYEGLGLPVLEGYQCGKICVTSNNSSLKEVAGNAAIMVDPYSNKSVADGMQKALTLSVKEKNDRLMEAERLRKEKFNKYAMADAAYNSIKQFAERKGGCKHDGVNKLAVFTPLPPVQSEISDFSVDIISGLAKNIKEIDVIVDGYETDCVLPSNVKIISLVAFKNKMKCNYYDEILYEFGNSEYHEYMIEMIRDYPGIVELHDINLQDLVLCLSGKSEDCLGTYRDFLKYDLTDTEIDNKLKRSGMDYDPDLVLNGFVSRYAKKLIVHSEWGKKEILERHIKDVSVIPHYVQSVSSCSPKGGLREKYGFSRGDLIIAAFGMVHETKRVIPIIHALSKLNEHDYDFKMIFVGKTLSLDFEREIKRLLVKFNLWDKVIITGYAELSVFIDYMKMCDIAVNLRYPYHGENSGALSRLMGMGKPVIINAIGSFDEVPDNACVKLPPPRNVCTVDEEAELIFGAVKALIESKDSRDEFGANALRYAEKNQIQALIPKYMEVLNKKISEEAIAKYIGVIRKGLDNYDEQLNKFAAFLEDGFGYTLDKENAWRMAGKTCNEVVDIRGFRNLENERFADELYRTFLGRNPSEDEKRIVLKSLRETSGNKSEASHREDIIRNMASSEEVRNKEILSLGYENITVSQLVRADGDYFIRLAYCWILGRDADESGLTTYRLKLKEGELTKKDFIYILRFSEEGKTAAVSVIDMPRFGNTRIKRVIKKCVRKVMS